MCSTPAPPIPCGWRSGARSLNTAKVTRCRRRGSRSTSCPASRRTRCGPIEAHETRLADITLKRGGTGTLVFATVTTSVFGAAGLAIEEERRTVFRDEVKPGEGNQAPRREPAPTDVA
jgi:hypothetical protein